MVANQNCAKVDFVDVKACINSLMSQNKSASLTNITGGPVLIPEQLEETRIAKAL